MTIKELRIKTGLKKTQFAAEADISISYYAKIEKGMPASQEFLQRILNAANRRLGTSYTLADLNGVNIR